MGKEFRHIRRDVRTLLVVGGMPVLMVLLYGTALTFDVRALPVGVWDPSGSTTARRLTERLDRSGYFAVVYRAASDRDLVRALDERRIRMALLFPRDLERRQSRGEPVPIQVLLDGSDPNLAVISRGYIEMALAQYSQELAGAAPIRVEPRFWYNPELVSVYYIVPGLVTIILMLVSALLTSITLVRERETGTLEQLLISPVRPAEIIIGKLFPYAGLALLDGLLILATAHGVYRVPFAGRLRDLGLASAVFVLAALAMGLLISSVARTQLVAMLAALMATILPSVLLSGFIFPIPSMPRAIRLVTYAVPARYYLTIIRNVVLKGTGPEVWWPELAVLGGFAVGLLTLATLRFRRALDDSGGRHDGPGSG